MFDAVEIRPLRLPVIGVAPDLDVFFWLKIDQFERAGADRMLTHLPWRYVARIDRRIARGEQRQQGRLRTLQVDHRLVIAIGGDLLDILPPFLVLRLLAVHVSSRTLGFGRSGYPIHSIRHIA